eukprot:PhF_6_TR10776/c0_g1_i2/m.17299/K02564/nagB, GNPDA; glucosamine-6-phosphate deaminase
MRIVRMSDYNSCSVAAADYIVNYLQSHPTSTVIFPTGKSVEGLYKELISRKPLLSSFLSTITVVILDEYVGIPLEDPRSLYNWLSRTLLEPLGIQPAQVIKFEAALDLEAAEQRCLAVKQALSTIRIDLAVLGIGPNGHLGYNEPPSNAASTTRVLKLTSSSTGTCSKDWGGDRFVLPYAMTLGLDILLQSKEIVLIVNGKHKQEILAKALGKRGEGPNDEVPASYLQVVDPSKTNVTIICDEDAFPAE